MLNNYRRLIFFVTITFFVATNVLQVQAVSYKTYAKKSLGVILGGFCVGSVVQLFNPEIYNWQIGSPDEGHADIADLLAYRWYNALEKNHPNWANGLFAFVFPAYVVSSYAKEKMSSIETAFLNLGLVVATGYGSYQLLKPKNKRKWRRKRREP
jgi:hypothetical protein